MVKSQRSCMTNLVSLINWKIILRSIHAFYTIMSLYYESLCIGKISEKIGFNDCTAIVIGFLRVPTVLYSQFYYSSHRAPSAKKYSSTYL